MSRGNKRARARRAKRNTYRRMRDADADAAAEQRQLRELDALERQLLGRQLSVGGLNYTAGAPSIQRFFESLVAGGGGAVLGVHHNEEKPGLAIVEMDSDAAVQRVLALASSARRRGVLPAPGDVGYRGSVRCAAARLALEQT
jgi:hypothetical protein